MKKLFKLPKTICNTLEYVDEPIEPEYRITVPSLEHLTFTRHFIAREDKDLQSVLEEVLARDALLISAGESILFELYSEGHDHPDQDATNGEPWCTRTAAISFAENGKEYVAFDDTANNSENIIINKFIPQIYERIKKNDYCDIGIEIPRNDPCITRAIEEAKQQNRVYCLSDDPEIILTETRGETMSFPRCPFSDLKTGEKTHAQLLYKIAGEDVMKEYEKNVAVRISKLRNLYRSSLYFTDDEFNDQHQQVIYLNIIGNLKIDKKEAYIQPVSIGGGKLEPPDYYSTSEKLWFPYLDVYVNCSWGNVLRGIKHTK